MRHIDATVVDQTHLRVHPPLAMPVGASIRLAIVKDDIEQASSSQPASPRAKGMRASVLARYLRHPLKLRSFNPLTREQAHDRA